VGAPVIDGFAGLPVGLDWIAIESLPACLTDLPSHATQLLPVLGASQRDLSGINCCASRFARYVLDWGRLS
jgi:hypothetical protein